MIGPEIIPLSSYCPLKESSVDEATKIQARDRAVDLEYNSWPVVEPGKISGVLINELNIDRETADLAVECLGKIIRNYCPNCEIDRTETDIGLIPRAKKKYR